MRLRVRRATPLLWRCVKGQREAAPAHRGTSCPGSQCMRPNVSDGPPGVTWACPDGAAPAASWARQTPSWFVSCRPRRRRPAARCDATVSHGARQTRRQARCRAHSSGAAVAAGTHRATRARRPPGPLASPSARPQRRTCMVHSHGAAQTGSAHSVYTEQRLRRAGRALARNACPFSLTPQGMWRTHRAAVLTPPGRHRSAGHGWLE